MCTIAGCRVLDIGSGLGDVDLLLATKRRGAAEVIGIDVEPQLIAAAEDYISQEGLQDRIKFRLVREGPLPFPEARFDAVFSKDAMVHIGDKRALFAEVVRVLRPGGFFIAADWLWAKGAGANPVVQRWLSATPLKFAFTTVPEARETMQQAGFADIAVEDRRARCCRWPIARKSRFPPARKQLAGLVGEEMAKARLASALGRQAALDSGDLIPCHLRGSEPG